MREGVPISMLDIKSLDITKTNAPIERLLEVTENPRHRFLLQNFHRHRYLEISGRYKEIFVPEMTVEHPVYHMHAQRINTTLDGREAVEGLYRYWAETDQCIFYADPEGEVAVADHFIATVDRVAYQQVLGKVLIEGGIDVDDENAMYLYKSFDEMVWPYDDRGRMIGEDVWEVDPSKAEITKLDPADVMTVEEAAEKLNPLIKPLPSFDEEVLGASQR
jgi:hypothetical protein